MQLTQTVFAIAASLPEVIQAGETLLLNFRVTLNDPDIGILENAAIAFVVRQGADKLLEVNSNAMPWATQVDERSPTTFAGTLTVDTLPLIPYVNTRAVDVGWYVSDGQNLSFSPIRKARVREAIAVPDTAPQLAIAQVLGSIVQAPLIGYLPPEAYELELSQQLGAIDQQPAIASVQSLAITQQLQSTNQQPTLGWAEGFEIEIGQFLGVLSQQPAIAITQSLAAQHQLGGIAQAPEIGNGVAIAIIQQLQATQQSPEIRQEVAIALGQQLEVISQAPSLTFTEAIAITAPSAFQTYQRNGSNQGNIPIAGTATPNRAIEARWGGGAWSAIATSSGGGTFSGTLTGMVAGQGILEVRLASDPTVTSSVANVLIGDVFWVAGQSNAVGRFGTLQEYSHATLKAAMFREAGGWLELAANSDSDNPATGFIGSVWGLVATQFLADQGVPIAFITTADGSTALVNPTPAHWPKGGTSYNEAIARVAASNAGGIRAILWDQGEKDAEQGTTQTAYANALSLMLDNMQIDAGLPGAKLLCGHLGSITNGSATEARVNAIRLAQGDRWASDPDILMGALKYDLALRDGLHPADSEIFKLADRWWRATKGHLYGGESPRSLQFLSASAPTAGKVVVALTGGVGSELAGVSTAGWRVQDANGVRTISSAIATGKQVELTIGEALVAPVVVSFGFGNDAIGATLRDQGSIPLPPEPFVERTVDVLFEPEPPGQYDPEVETFNTRVLAQSGSISTTDLDKFDAFVKGLKADGLWDLIDLAHVFVRVSGLAGTRVRLKHPESINHLATYFGLVSGDLTVDGIRGGSLSKYIDTLFDPTAQSCDVSNFGLYADLSVAGQTNATNWFLGMGMDVGAVVSNTVIGNGSSGTAKQAGIATAGTNLVAPANSTTILGLQGVQTNGSRSQQFYHNGNPLGGAVNANIVTFSDTAGNLFALVRNLRNAANGFTTARLRSLFITKGLSGAQVAQLNTRWTTFLSEAPAQTTSPPHIVMIL